MGAARSDLGGLHYFWLGAFCEPMVMADRVWEMVVCGLLAGNFWAVAMVVCGVVVSDFWHGAAAVAIRQYCQICFCQSFH